MSHLWNNNCGPGPRKTGGGGGGELQGTTIIIVYVHHRGAKSAVVSIATVDTVPHEKGEREDIPMSCALQQSRMPDKACQQHSQGASVDIFFSLRGCCSATTLEEKATLLRLRPHLQRGPPVSTKSCNVQTTRRAASGSWGRGLKANKKVQTMLTRIQPHHIMSGQQQKPTPAYHVTQLERNRLILLRNL